MDGWNKTINGAASRDATNGYSPPQRVGGMPVQSDVAARFGLYSLRAQSHVGPKEMSHDF